jgi:peptidoglycan/LPS O-acetylase OafA/YrhL
VVDRALPLALAATLVLAAVLTPVWIFWDALLDRPLELWAARTGRVLYAWTMILTLLGLARRYLSGDGPVRRYLTEASFPVYILHQTITVAAGYALTRLGYGVWQEFVLLTAITFAGSFAGFEIARRIPVLRQLMGLKSKPKGARLSPA